MNNQVTDLTAQSPTTCRMIVEFDVPIGTDLANTTFDVGIKINGEESKEVFVEVPWSPTVNSRTSKLSEKIKQVTAEDAVNIPQNLRCSSL